MRKLNNIIGLLGPAVTVVLAGYAGCSAEWAIILFSASVGLSAFTIPGAKSRFDFHLCLPFTGPKIDLNRDQNIFDPCLKGVFSKPSGNHNVVPYFCLSSNCGYLLIF